MSVKIKLVIGFLVILAMVAVQSYLIVEMNNKRDDMSQQALVTFQYNLVIKDRMIDVKNLETDLLFKILNGEPITPDKEGMIRINSAGLSLFLLQWYDAFTTSPEFKIMHDALKSKVYDLKPKMDDLRAGLVEIRNMKTLDPKKRLQVYTSKMRQQIMIFQEVGTDFVGQNSAFYSVTNRSLGAYSRDMARNQAITIAAAIMFIVFIIFYVQHVLRPLNWLMAGVGAITNGDYDHYVRKRGNDELGRLADQFNNMSGEIKNHREHLEDIVEKRTLQLLEAKEQLEKTNESLTVTNRSLEHARRIMDLDMSMAINVQSSFFVKQAPVSSEWEIAYEFRPMAGVAGDLYDFYTDEEGNILGLAMMDVSGHGIASGLITMIAKTVASRIFLQQYDKKKLNYILEDINEELINELGNIDNYLTGIMLKFHDNLVEYVNAGHTELLIKRKGVPKAAVISPSESKGFKGLFLGLEAMKMPFSQLSFKMQKDDILLIFSDCLNESTNAAGEEYGLERILSCMNESNGESAQELLDHVVNDFHKFTGTDSFNDDLTLVAVRRL